MLRLEPDKFRLDIVRFHNHAAQRDFKGICEHYRGDFLAGFRCPTKPFEDWAMHLATELRQAYVTALLDICDERMAMADWHTAELIAAKLLLVDSLNERYARIHARAIGAQGDLMRSRTAYTDFAQRYRRELRQDLSWAWEEAVPERDALVVETDELETDGTAGRIPFVGRRTELAELAQELDNVLLGRGRVVVVSGEPGIGKTRFCMQALRLAAIRGGKVLLSRCHHVESQIPYVALVEALSAGLTQQDIAGLSTQQRIAISRLVPTLGGAQHSPPNFPAASGDEAGRRTILEAVAEVIRRRSKQDPVVLFIDDFQWADPSTVSVIHYLARSCHLARLLILLALRMEDITSPGIRSLVQRHQNDVFTMRHIRLGELTQSEILEMLRRFEARHGTVIEPDLEAQLISQAGGRPFFLLETLNWLYSSLRSHNTMERSNDRTPHRVLLADSVHEFLLARMSTLSPSAMGTIGALAVIGRAAPVDFLRAVTGLSADTVLNGLDELLQRGLVYEKDGMVEIAHDLLREAAYRSISAARRRHLHKITGDLLRRSGAVPTALIASHYDLAGESAVAFRLNVEAAKESEAIYALPEAARFLRVALANAEHETDRLMVEEALADTLFRMRNLTEAESLYKKLEGSPGHMLRRHTGLSINTRRAEIHIEKDAHLPSDMLPRLQRLKEEAQAVGDDEALGTLLRLQAQVAHAAGYRDVILGIIPELLSLAERVSGTPSGIEALRVAGSASNVYVGSEQSIPLLRKALQSAEVGGAPDHVIQCLGALGFNLLCAGVLDEAENVLHRALTHVERTGAVPHKPFIVNNLGVCFLERGKYGAAMEYFDQVLAAAEHIDITSDVVPAHANAAVACYEQGDYGQMRSHCLRLIGGTESMPSWWSRVASYGLLGLGALESGHLRDAHECVREIQREIDEKGFWVSDLSYPEICVARVTALEGKQRKAAERLGEVAEVYRGRDFFCLARLELERARLLLEEEPKTARAIAEEVGTAAKRVGAVPLVDRAERVLDRLASRCG